MAHLFAIFAPALSADHPRLFVRVAQPLLQSGAGVSAVCLPAVGDPISGVDYFFLEKKRTGPRRILPPLRGLREISKVIRSGDDVVICGGFDAWIWIVLLSPVLRPRAIVFDAAETFDESVREWANSNFVKNLLTSLIRILTRFLSKRTNEIIIARSTDCTRYSCSQILLRNLAPSVLNSREMAIPDARGEREKLVVANCGLFNVPRGSQVLIEALAKLEGVLPPKSIRLRIYGTLTDGNIEDYRHSVLGLSVIDELDSRPWMPYREVIRELYGSHLGLILFQPVNQNYRNPAPNKLFDYMFAGAVAIAPEWATDLRSYVPSDVAYFVDTASSSAVADALEWAFFHETERLERANNARKYLISLLDDDAKSQRELAAKLMDLYARA